MPIRELLGRIASWAGRLLLGLPEPYYGRNVRKILYGKALSERNRA